MHRESIKIAKDTSSMNVQILPTVGSGKGRYRLVINGIPAGQPLNKETAMSIAAMLRRPTVIKNQQYIGRDIWTY